MDQMQVCPCGCGCLFPAPDNMGAAAAPLITLPSMAKLADGRTIKAGDALRVHAGSGLGAAFTRGTHNPDPDGPMFLLDAWEAYKAAGGRYVSKCGRYYEPPDDALGHRVPRELHGHKVNPGNDALKVEALDQPGAGGANHEYRIMVPPCLQDPLGRVWLIMFQNGPIAEAGVNGVTHEALIAIVIDRLQAFQRGPYACRENALALTKLEEAQHWLHHRTKARMERGVEGTHTV